MSHDSRGALLQKGDRVLLEGILTEEPSQDGGYCNCHVQIVTPDQREKPPMSPPSLSAINTRMLTKITSVLLVALLFVASSRDCCAQQPKTSPIKKPPIPQVDTAEIYRRGDMVVVTGEDLRAASEEAKRQATAPPADDSHMWYVTVIKTTNCQYCDKLISDFQKAPELLAFVAATEPAKPWGHFNIYNAQDQTQAWRVKEYRISAYPTLVIQPPRNGMWGSPRTVVWQKTGYDGNPKKLAQEIGAAVRKYAAKMSEQGYPKLSPSPSPSPRNKSLVGRVNYEVVGGARQAAPEADQGAGQVGTDPPFHTPPKVDPFNPIPVGPNQPVPSTWPPMDQPSQIPIPSVGLLLSLLIQAVTSLLGGQGMANLLLLILVGLRVLERTAPITKTKLDDNALNILRSIYDAISGTQPSPPNPATPTT